MTKIFTKKNIWFIVVNSIVALVLFFLIQKVYFLPGDDSKVFFLGPVIKNALSKNASAPPADDFTLINTQYDNKVIPKYDADGHKYGNQVIVDRSKLVTFFTKLKAENSHKYVICDILFQDSTANDVELANLLKTTERVLIPLTDSLETTLQPFRPVNSGLVEVYTVANLFYKYKLFDRDRNLKSIPLKLYEDLHKVNYQDYHLFGKLGDKFVLNDFVPEHYINSYNVFETETYKLYNLGDISRPVLTFNDYVEDKIIVIGNFNLDTRGTIYGDIPGSLTLVNTYLGMEKGKNVISLGLILLLWLICLGYSFAVILPKATFKKILSRIPFISGILMGVSYAIVMIILALLIYFVFNVNLSLIYLAAFFYLENLIYHRKIYWERFKENLRAKD